MLVTAKDKRGFARIKVDCTVSFRREGAAGPVSHGNCRDISASGILFLAKDNIAVGTRLEISVLPGNRVTPPLNAIIQVVRTTPCERTGALYVAGAIQTLLA